MTADPDGDASGLSGEDVEAVIDRATGRIEAASNAITLKDYAANLVT
jgi:hypothetical protein